MFRFLMLLTSVELVNVFPQEPHVYSVSESEQPMQENIAENNSIEMNIIDVFLNLLVI